MKRQYYNEWHSQSLQTYFDDNPSLPKEDAFMLMIKHMEKIRKGLDRTSDKTFQEGIISACTGVKELQFARLNPAQSSSQS